MLQGGCQLLLPAGLRSPEIHLFFLIGGLLLYNMVLVSLIHQHGSAVCVTCPPSRTSLPSRLSQSPCVSSLSHAAHSPHRLFYTSWCARFHATLSTRPTLALASVSTSLLFMRDTRSVSPWAQCRPCGREPRGDTQGIRKETDSSLAPECGFSPSEPPSGASVFMASSSSQPSWEQAPGCFLPPQGRGVLGHSLFPVLSSPASIREY